MIHRRLSTLCALALLSTWSAPAAAAGAVGEPAPVFSLEGAAGETVSLAELAGKTVVLEWMNPNCPFSARHAKERTMATLAERYRGSEVVWLAINSTNPDHGDYLQPAEHLAWNRDHGVTYPVLYDGSGEVGKAFDAKTTPHMYIVDGSGNIVYNGAIDDDRAGRMVPEERHNYVDLGLAALGGGDRPDPATTKPYGCSVKY